MAMLLVELFPRLQLVVDDLVAQNGIHQIRVRKERIRLVQPHNVRIKFSFCHHGHLFSLLRSIIMTKNQPVNANRIVKNATIPYVSRKTETQICFPFVI